MAWNNIFQSAQILFVIAKFQFIPIVFVNRVLGTNSTKTKQLSNDKAIINQWATFEPNAKIFNSFSPFKLLYIASQKIFQHTYYHFKSFICYDVVLWLLFHIVDAQTNTTHTQFHFYSLLAWIINERRLWRHCVIYTSCIL